MRQAVGGDECQFERLGIGDTSTFEVRRLHALGSGQYADLLGGAVDQHDPDVERSQQRHIQQERREALVADDAGIDREHEGLLAKLRHILQDPAQVGEFHRSRPLARQSARCSVNS